MKSNRKLKLIRKKDGLAKELYYAQVRNSKLRGRVPPVYSKKELVDWLYPQRLGIKYATESQFTLEETGKVLGVTRERVRQIEANVVKRLKHPGQSLLTKEANYE